MSKKVDSSEVIKISKIFKLFISHKEIDISRLDKFVRNYDDGVAVYNTTSANSYDLNGEYHSTGTAITKFTNMDRCLEFLSDVQSNYHLDDFPISSAYPTDEGKRLYYSKIKTISGSGSGSGSSSTPGSGSSSTPGSGSGSTRLVGSVVVSVPPVGSIPLAPPVSAPSGSSSGSGSTRLVGSVVVSVPPVGSTPLISGLVSSTPLVSGSTPVVVSGSTPVGSTPVGSTPLVSGFVAARLVGSVSAPLGSSSSSSSGSGSGSTSMISPHISAPVVEYIFDTTTSTLLIEINGEYDHIHIAKKRKIE